MVVIHKRVNTVDSKLVEQTTRWANNPLERNLEIFDFGRYVRAPEEEEFAFAKVNEMWNEQDE